MEDGTYYPFSPQDLAVTEDGGHLLLSLERERTEAGRGLVRALWFDQQVFLWENGCRSVLRPVRCHIVGKVFSARYRYAKARDENAEVAAVWELEVTACAAAGQDAPDPLPLHPAGVPEYHLDHPSLHGPQG